MFSFLSKKKPTTARINAVPVTVNPKETLLQAALRQAALRHARETLAALPGLACHARAAHDTARVPSGRFISDRQATPPCKSSASTSKACFSRLWNSNM